MRSPSQNQSSGESYGHSGDRKTPWRTWPSRPYSGFLPGCAPTPNIKGASRAGGKELAAHLGNAEKNEKVVIVRIEGTMSQDMRGAFAEMEAIASGTQCKKPLYHAKISPDPKEPRLTPEQWNRAVEALAKEMGMDGHAYVFVLHQKYGKFTPDVLREHGHVVFNRIDPDTMKAVHDGHNYRKHEVVSRQLEAEFGHARIQGAHVGRENGQPRPDRPPPEWSMQQAAKSGIDPRDLASQVRGLWGKSDSPQAFAEALKQDGLTLAIGRRDLVILDHAGDVHTLARCLNLKVADIRERMAGIDRSTLPTVEQARDAMRKRHSAAPDTAGRTVGNRDHANDNLKPPAPAHSDPQKAALMELALLLQKPTTKPPAPAQQQPANDNEALREKLTAFGFDASKPATLDKWQQLQEKVDGGRITEKERLREMALYLWHEADKEHRANPKAKEPQRLPDRDRG